MTRGTPKTPVAMLIIPRMAALGIGRTEIVKHLGWSNQTKGLRHFDVLLATGKLNSHLLKGLPGVLGLNAGDVEDAAAASRQQIEEAEESQARKRFHPHIVILTKSKVRMPFFVQAFAWNEKVLALSEDFDLLSLSRQVSQASRIVLRNFRKNRGDLGTWGSITGYRLQRAFDHAVVLNTDGTIREGFNRDPESPPPELGVKGSALPPQLFG